MTWCLQQLEYAVRLEPEQELEQQHQSEDKLAEQLVGIVEFVRMERPFYLLVSELRKRSELRIR